MIERIIFSYLTNIKHVGRILSMRRRSYIRVTRLSRIKPLSWYSDERIKGLTLFTKATSLLFSYITRNLSNKTCPSFPANCIYIKNCRKVILVAMREAVRDKSVQPRCYNDDGKEARGQKYWLPLPYTLMIYYVAIGIVVMFKVARYNEKKRLSQVIQINYL